MVMGRGESKVDKAGSGGTNIVPKAVASQVDRFGREHANDKVEYGESVDMRGNVTYKSKGVRGEVTVPTRAGEIKVHNHTTGRTFSAQDLNSVALNSSKGVVATTKNGAFYFIKGDNFQDIKFASRVMSDTFQIQFNFAEESKRIQWLKDNQAKYGYKFAFVKR